MGLFSNNPRGGLMDVIRCDEENYLIWKWHPTGSNLGETQRENSIRWGSSLRVKEGSVAVFVYSGNENTIQDYIVGPADTIINTKNLPLISSVLGLAYNGGSPFQAEVYFINVADTIQLKFAVPFFDVFDSELQEFSVPIAARGSLDFNISNYREFIKKHRLDNFSLEELQSQIKDTVSENVKNIIANAPDKYKIPVIQIEKKIEEIKAESFNALTNKLFTSYGISLSDINLAAIEVNKDSQGYQELKKVTKDLTSATLKNRNKAQNIAESREIKSEQTINMFDKAANKFVDIKEKQFIRHKKAEAEYSEVIEDKRAGKIGAVGGKVLRDIGKLTRRDSKNSADLTPPPIPNESMYNVAVDGNPTGPFDMNTLAQMAKNNELSKDSLVWKKGMSEWNKAGSVEELKDLFEEMPPIPNN